MYKYLVYAIILFGLLAVIGSIVFFAKAIVSIMAFFAKIGLWAVLLVVGLVALYLYARRLFKKKSKQS